LEAQSKDLGEQSKVLGVRKLKPKTQQLLHKCW
jgi:hypothetical protein